MSKFNNLNPEICFAPFAGELGELLPKLVSDAKAMLGRLEKDIQSKPGDWKATAQFKLKSSEGYTLQLPPNNPLAILLCFGMRVNEIAKAGGMEIVSTIPKLCEAWIEQERVAAKMNSNAKVQIK